LDQRSPASHPYALWREDRQAHQSQLEYSNMSRTDKLTPKLRKAQQPPLSHAGATADADRAKSPPLVQHDPDAGLNPGDRVMGLGDFGKPTGGFGTVVKTNEDDALVKWDDDGRMRLRQPWLKKVSSKVHPLGKPARA
jgi:hypothetical protein